MANHSRAGQPAQQSDLINVAQLTAQYYVLKTGRGQRRTRSEVWYIWSPRQRGAPQL